jgi:hypothetical protein
MAFSSNYTPAQRTFVAGLSTAMISSIRSNRHNPSQPKQNQYSENNIHHNKNQSVQAKNVYTHTMNDMFFAFTWVQ